jgi:TRAP-type mannitol/chloroaromatic compound transport system permease small subunit
LIHRLDGVSRAVGHLSGWLCLLLLLITVEQVIARYLFQGASIALQELQWHLFGAMFTLSMAWSLKDNQHVRVDLFHDKFSPRVKNGIEVFGLVLFVMPMATILIVYGWQDVMTARSYTSPYPIDHYTQMVTEQGQFLYNILSPIENLARKTVLVGESSSMSSGLEARWIPKAFIPIGGVLLLFQAFLQTLKVFFPDYSEAHAGN